MTVEGPKAGRVPNRQEGVTGIGNGNYTLTVAEIEKKGGCGYRRHLEQEDPEQLQIIRQVRLIRQGGLIILTIILIIRSILL